MCAKERQLAAENVALKILQAECFVGHVEVETFYDVKVTRYVSADGSEPETRCTDYIVAKINTDAVEKFAIEQLRIVEGYGEK